MSNKLRPRVPGEPLNASESAILALAIANPGLTQAEIGAQIGLQRRAVAQLMTHEPLKSALIKARKKAVTRAIDVAKRVQQRAFQRMEADLEKDETAAKKKLNAFHVAAYAKASADILNPKKVELTGKEGGPIEWREVDAKKLEKLNDEELANLERIAAILETANTGDDSGGEGEESESLEAASGSAD